MIVASLARSSYLIRTYKYELINKFTLEINLLNDRAKAFSLTRCLKKFKQIHFEQKLYKCDKCAKFFSL